MTSLKVVPQKGKTIYEFYRKRPLKQKNNVRGSSGRRISFNPDIVAFMEEEGHTRILEELCHNEWIIFKSTPLFKVPQNKKGFSEISDKLSRIMSLGELSYVVNVEEVCGLRGSLADHSALKITLHVSYHSRVGETPILIAFFLGVDTKDINLYSENTSVLPVLLISGHRKAVSGLVESLQIVFDSSISKACFHEDELRWMFALWSGFESSPKRNTVYMDYKLPPSVKGIKLLQVAVSYTDLLSIWNSVHSTSESEFTLKEMKTFYSKLYDHLETVYGIHFSSLALNVFSLPTVTFHQNGTINIHEVKYLKNMIGYLTERFQNNLQAAPRIGVQLESFL